MPSAQIITVISFAWITGGRAKIVEVAGSAGCGIIVIPHGGECPRLVAAPGRIVIIVELLRRAVIVDVVAQGEDGAGDVVKQLGRGLISVPVACNVTGADKHH